jgi:hypothetical protein
MPKRVKMKKMEERKSVHSLMDRTKVFLTFDIDSNPIVHNTLQLF